MAEALHFVSAVQHPYLVSSSVFEAVKRFAGADVLVAEIDPAYAGGEALCEHYGVDPTMGANCIVVEAKKRDRVTTAAILVPVGKRADLNGAVRRALDARQVSLAPLEKVLSDTGMEYGSVTPLGLPPGWQILVDASLVEKENIVVGGGLKKSKLLLPVRVLLAQENTSSLPLCKSDT